MAPARRGVLGDAWAWEFTASARGIARRRREVAEAVRALGGDVEAVAVARLGVSELLSNVVRHVPDTRCRLEVERVADDVCVRVVDRSAEPPVVSEPDWDTERGRGLWLLREMVTGFGHARAGGGKAVWFRCPLDGGRA
ncbi:ATP-binding protein [Streptomyces sp. WMMC1477]|uniref:ATP-binding protein n=1 Tax=Streptomyces sp. WMMC1477 TaxID=3015155 RepID=UPI0022B68567|nr:ATP-binding protein [Streptomyces sp. WMMC1477]MCZ7431788.1 ATP-binding protein [Streptomyces sp. WMMC1477]